MGRLLVILSIWALGFFIGFIGYLIYPYLAQLISIFLSALSLHGEITGAIISGFVGSFITTISVIIWGRLSKKAI